MFIEKLKKLEPKFKDWAIENIGFYIVGLQAIFYLLIISGFISRESLELIPAKVIESGQIWRIFTFAFIPPASNLFFLMINWYIFIIISQYLEAFWGTFLFNVYCFIVFAISIITAFLVLLITSDFVSITPEIFNYSLFFIIFLAFSVLNPEFEVLLFFVLPLKIKYVAYISSVFYLISFLIFTITLLDKLIMLIFLLTFVLFFYDTIKLNFLQKNRIRSFQKGYESQNEAMHICVECGKSDTSDPELEFRYRNENGQAVCYCNLCRS